MAEQTVRSVAVVGAGTMGTGIAFTFARSGLDVRVTDVMPAMLDRARGTIDTICTALIGGGVLTDEEAASARNCVTFTTSQEDAVREADFVLEAIPERLEIKQSFFKSVEEQVREDTILASNTSGISITKIAEAVKLPGRLVGMHWSNPPHLIPVVEVIKGAKTDEDVAEATRQVVRQIGMMPVTVERDVPGFVQNRILYAIMRESLHLLEAGVASAEDIDTITKWGIGLKLSVIGPLELLDVAGLDIYNSVAGYLNPDLSAAGTVSSVVTEKVQQGNLGIKTGRGLFEYEPGEIQALVQRRTRLLLQAKRALTS